MSNATPIVTRRSKIYRTAVANLEMASRKWEDAKTMSILLQSDEAAKNLAVWEANCTKALAQLREIESMMA